MVPWLTTRASSPTCSMLSTAVSELARNILKYARRGEVTVRVLEDGRTGVEVVASDEVTFTVRTENGDERQVMLLDGASRLQVAASIGIPELSIEDVFTADALAAIDTLFEDEACGAEFGEVAADKAPKKPEQVVDLLLGARPVLRGEAEQGQVGDALLHGRLDGAHRTRPSHQQGGDHVREHHHVPPLRDLEHYLELKR